MAERFLRELPDLRPYVLSNVQTTGTKIGEGAYGTVTEVEIPVCAAAKKLHDCFLDSAWITTQFVKEVQLMSTLRHENLVQFLGVYFDSSSTQLPALVMERLLTSLHDFLEGSSQSIYMCLKCSILHNVASGIAYLHQHSPSIIHRDLSARNVLLTSELVAKVADMGMARFLSPSIAATMTKAPGALVYMPPEATAPSTSNAEEAIYDSSIDVFSLGVITLFTVGEEFPKNLHAPNYTNVEGVLVPRTELERRSTYMEKVEQQLRKDHPLIYLIQQSLHNTPSKRPGIHNVLDLIESARAEVKDEDCETNKRQILQTLQSQPRNENLSNVFHDMVMEVAVLRQELKKEKQLVQEMEQQDRDKDELLRDKDREISDLKLRLSSGGGLDHDCDSEPETPLPKVTVECHKQKQAPFAMERGSATCDSQFAYFTPHGRKLLYRYELNTEKWEKLPSCPYRDSGLLIIDGTLNAVGGWEGMGYYTNKVCTLYHDEWVQEYPGMNTARSCPAVVCTANGRFVVGIGGHGGLEWTNAVELLDVKTRMWHKLAELPSPLMYPSAAICGNQICVIGDRYNGFICSLQEVQTSDQMSLQSPLHIINWAPIPRLPVTVSTAASLGKELVIVGGMRRPLSLVSSIYKLKDGEWVEIGSMLSARYRCLVVTPIPESMVVVGGRGHWGLSALNTVERCTV